MKGREAIKMEDASGPRIVDDVVHAMVDALCTHAEDDGETDPASPHGVLFDNTVLGMILISKEFERVFQQIKTPQEEFEEELSDLREQFREAEDRNNTNPDAPERRQAFNEAIKYTIEMERLKAHHSNVRGEKEAVYQQTISKLCNQHNETYRRIFNAALPRTGTREDGMHGTLVFYQDRLAAPEEHDIPEAEPLNDWHSAEGSAYIKHPGDNRPVQANSKLLLGQHLPKMPPLPLPRVQPSPVVQELHPRQISRKQRRRLQEGFSVPRYDAQNRPLPVVESTAARWQRVSRRSVPEDFI